jgi:hypothetical protein
MAVDVEATGRAFSAGVPRRVAAETITRKGVAHTGWDVARDGRLLVTRLSGGGGRPTDLHVVQHWLDDIARRVPRN